MLLQKMSSLLNCCSTVHATALAMSLSPLRCHPIAGSLPAQSTSGCASPPTLLRRRNVGSLLNKLTRVNIGFIYDRIIAGVDECEGVVRGNVQELFSQLLFDRAVDEPERTGIYISLCEAVADRFRGRYLCHGIKKEILYGEATISNYLAKCWDNAQGSLSWGESIFGSRTAESAAMRSVDEYYMQLRRPDVRVSVSPTLA